MGLHGDREYTLLFEGKRANQKQVPHLYQLEAKYLGDQLILNYPGQSEFCVDTKVYQPAQAIDIYTKQVEVLDMGEEVAGWLSECMTQKVRLVRATAANPWFMPLAEFKAINTLPQSKFVDAAPLLLANSSSLENLNKRLESQQGVSVLMDRFRPNLVLEGLRAYEEDSLKTFIFPNLTLTSIAVCERCIVTTTHQQTGVRGKEPLRTLSKYRKRQNDYAGGIMFGTYVFAESTGSISMADELSL